VGPARDFADFGQVGVQAGDDCGKLFCSRGQVKKQPIRGQYLAELIVQFAGNVAQRGLLGMD